MRSKITVETTVQAPVNKVWEYWAKPEHITHWNFASDDWSCPKAENDLRPGGKFNYRMEAKDGSSGFDFEGTYTAVEDNKKIEYIMSDGRKVTVEFESQDNQTKVVESFDPEDENPLELQKSGWQSILDNFKKYTESN